MLERIEVEHISEKDITKLLQEKRFLQSIIDGIKDQIMVVDREYRIKEANELLVERLKRPKHEIVDKFCYSVLHNLNEPCNIPNHPCPVQETLKTGRTSEALHTHFKGREVSYYRVIAYPIFDDQGNIAYVIEMARDVTKWKRAGEKMHNVQKLAALGELAAGVAHELNNPIAIILGFSDLLLEETEPDSKEYKMLKAIERQGLNCKKIIENFLSLASYHAKTEYSTDVNINLQKVLSVVENILVSKNITLKKNLLKDLPKVRGDPGDLQQVFVNLITNAVDAMEEGGVLTISTRLNETGNRAEIVFEDTGHGIKKEYRERIFDPFFTTKRMGEGTGLGLSVSYGIVTKYGGEINFETISEEDEKEKKGTTFIVSLPVVPSESE
ncbi:MAG: two-component system sensor histidine kinase NtrB [Thermodesulfovibrionales bacterium]